MKFVAKFSIILGVIFLISGILATGLFFASFDWNNLEGSIYFTYLNQQKNYSVQEIEEVNLNFVSEEIVVEKISGEEFVFNLQGYYPKNRDGEYPELQIEKTGKNLNVHVEFLQKRYLFGIGSRKSSLHVGIPEKYFGNFKIDVSSGEIFVNNFAFKNFESDSTSGEIELRNLKVSGNCIIETSSGNININNLSCENLNEKSVSGEIISENLEVEGRSYFQTSSGDIDTKKLQTDYGEFKSVSGEITLIDSGEINFIKTSSGDISISGLNAKNNLDIESVSGDVDIGLIEGSSVDLKYKSVSGNLKNDFGNVYDGDYEIYIKTSSGDLRIY